MKYSYELRETLLKLSNVNVAYDGVPILRDVNLEIRNIVRPGMEQGQVVALVGPSGMGKTTLFRILAGLMKPDSGEILVGPEQRPVERGMVGVVAQNYPLFHHRTVRGNLLVAGKQARLSGDVLNKKADELLSQFGITEHAAKYPTQ
jgi:ABC-type sugar transport system ATPase subunit